MVRVGCEMGSRDEGENLLALGQVHRSLRAIFIVSLLQEGDETLGGKMRLGRAGEMKTVLKWADVRPPGLRSGHYLKIAAASWVAE